MNYRTEFTLPEGRVVIQALPAPLIEQTAELLATSFITAVSQLAPYSQYLRRNIVQYLREHQALPPRAVVLVAVLQPTAPPEAALAAEDEGVGPAVENAAAADTASSEDQPASLAAASPAAQLLSGRRLRVIGSAEVSCHPSTRSPQAFIDAPKKCSYLSNMAVSPVFRRKGVATQLLLAAEELARTVMAEGEIYLHLRFVDTEAAKLYNSAGFKSVAEHWPIVALIGLQRMKLMRKELLP